jgi:hypothetical protein
VSSRGWEVKRFGVWGLLVAIAAWLWPIGFGGKMPVGGDVTQFSLGPMAVLARALRGGRLPIWNDLWGYGFPGLAESQMGVYYPPHWLLYGLLAPERAYTVSLVLHTLWGGLGAYFAARRFGASEIGSALGGLAWSTSGFFSIHLPHQWGYTTGCWMPWAWGLAWSVLRSEGRPREPFLLALVLMVQLLPGHFQLAFCTQVAVLVLALEQAVEARMTRSVGLAGVARTLAALGGAFALAAMQLWPTFRLARLAATQRDFEYLSGFAASPLHLVTFLAPGLFGRSPLWRPIVWDPFHTSPEEYLGFVGIVPLFLALGAFGYGWRRSPAVRALGVVGLVTLLLSLGPYVPGFRIWSGLPGFSFFRAPARWILGTSLALSSLAALGFDSLVAWKRPGRAALTFGLTGLVVPALVVLAIELGLWSAGRPGLPVVASLYQRVFQALPWHEESAFEEAVQAASRPNVDLRVQQTWARQGVRLERAPSRVFMDQRFAIYRQELAGSALILVALIALAPGVRSRFLPAGLIVLTVLDLGWINRVRPVDVEPIATLASRSPVLARLASGPPGVRTIESLHNMAMVVGAAPVSAYRTLDLPALKNVTLIAQQVPDKAANIPDVLRAIRATGAGVRIFDPLECMELDRWRISWPGGLEEVSDPSLAGWRYGTDWVAQQGKRGARFKIARAPDPVARGWLMPLTEERSAAILGTWSGSPWEVLDTIERARPLDVRASDPEHREVAFRSDGPALVLLTELADPEWRAILTGPGGERAAVVERAYGRPNQGAWQAVKVPGPGEWTLRLAYRGRDVYEGLVMSGVALAVLAVLYVRYGREPIREGGERP